MQTILLIGPDSDTIAADIRERYPDHVIIQSAQEIEVELPVAPQPRRICSQNVLRDAIILSHEFTGNYSASAAELGCLQSLTWEEFKGRQYDLVLDNIRADFAAGSYVCSWGDSPTRQYPKHQAQFTRKRPTKKARKAANRRARKGRKAAR